VSNLSRCACTDVCKFDLNNAGDLHRTGYNNFVFDPNVDEGCTKSVVGFQLDENVANALFVFFS